MHCRPPGSSAAWVQCCISFGHVTGVPSVCPELQFDGTSCYLRLSHEEVAGVLLVAADNASEARIVAAEVQQNAARQQRHIAEAAAQLFALVASPTAPDAHANTV